MNYQCLAKYLIYVSYLEFDTLMVPSFSSPAPWHIGFPPISSPSPSQSPGNLQGRRACISGDRMRRCGAGVGAGTAVVGAVAVVVEVVVTAAEGKV